MFLRLRRCDEAREQVELGARLDPLTALVNEAVGAVYMGCGEPIRAVEVFDQVLRMHPDAHTTRYQRGRALIRAGRFDEAIAALETLVATVPSETATSVLAVAYAKAGRLDDAKALIPQMTAPFLRASAFAAVGDTDQMWKMLDQAVAKDAGGLQNLISEAVFEPYHGQQRFLDIAQRAGFSVPPIPAARFAHAVPAVVVGNDRIGDTRR